MPRVAVNIVTYNSSWYIQRCLEAVFDQTYADVAVTVIDNGSEDDTVAKVRQLMYRGLALIQNPTNEGYARANNQGIVATDSEFVLTVNPDVLLTPAFVECLVAAVLASPRVGSAAGRLFQISSLDFREVNLTDLSLRDHRTIDSAGLGMHRNRRQLLRGHGKDCTECCREKARIMGPDGAAAFYRRSMLKDVAIDGEFFDEMLNTHKEDVDLVWRAQLLGWESIYEPEAMAYHVRGFRPRSGLFTPRERRSVPPAVRRLAIRNRWLVNIKNDLPLLFLAHLPHIIAYDLAIVGYMLLFEQPSLLAVWDFLKLLPRALRKRRRVQSCRVNGSRYMRQWFV